MMKSLSSDSNETHSAPGPAGGAKFLAAIKGWKGWDYYYYYYYYYRLLRHKGSTQKTCKKHWNHKTWKD